MIFYQGEESVDSGFNHRDIERVKLEEVTVHIASIDGGAQGGELLLPRFDRVSLGARVFHALQGMLERRSESGCGGQDSGFGVALMDSKLDDGNAIRGHFLDLHPRAEQLRRTALCPFPLG